MAGLACRCVLVRQALFRQQVGEDAVRVLGAIGGLHPHHPGDLVQLEEMMARGRRVRRLTADVGQQVAAANHVDVQRAVGGDLAQAVQVAAYFFDFAEHEGGMTRRLAQRLARRHDGQTAQLDALAMEKRLAQPPAALQRHQQHVIGVHRHAIDERLADDGQRVDAGERDLTLGNLPDPGAQQIRADECREQHLIVATPVRVPSLDHGVAVGGIAEQAIQARANEGSAVVANHVGDGLLAELFLDHVDQQVHGIMGGVIQVQGELGETVLVGTEPQRLEQRAARPVIHG